VLGHWLQQQERNETIHVIFMGNIAKINQLVFCHTADFWKEPVHMFRRILRRPVVNHSGKMILQANLPINFFSNPCIILFLPCCRYGCISNVHCTRMYDVKTMKQARIQSNCVHMADSGQSDCAPIGLRALNPPPEVDCNPIQSNPKWAIQSD